jgi:predicted Zn-dependent protease with MMP-like domain
MTNLANSSFVTSWVWSWKPDTITLYREPILMEWIETGEDLFRLVRSVLIHEIAHHFGFSDEDIERLEEEEG